MSLRRPRTRPPEGEFALAPMIDMVFLLLVFFMSVSHLAQAERPAAVELPASAEAKVPEEPEPGLILTLSEDGSWLLGTEKLSPAGLDQHLRAAMTRSGQSVITLRASAETPYEKVQEAMRACRAAGIVDLKFAAYESQ